jgi:hypothetical protein
MSAVSPSEKFAGLDNPARKIHDPRRAARGFSKSIDLLDETLRSPAGANAR